MMKVGCDNDGNVTPQMKLLQWHNAFPSSSGDGKGACYNDIIVKEKKKMKEKEGKNKRNEV
jgi:hypothetical protein